jgi:hypothetical protein
MALGDGLLIDVTPAARTVMIRHPVAISAGVHARCVAVPEVLEHDDTEDRRTWDLLWVLVRAIFKKRVGSLVEFEVVVRKDKLQLDIERLVAVCGQGDHGEPVVTVLLPEEARS